MFLLLAIPAIHFVGDFLLQTEWMVNGKSTAWQPLLAHAAVYTLTLLFFSSLVMPFPLAIAWSFLNGACHLTVDFFTSKLMKSARENGNTSLFFKILGLDQLLHAWCLLGILGWLIL